MVIIEDTQMGGHQGPNDSLGSVEVLPLGVRSLAAAAAAAAVPRFVCPFSCSTFLNVLGLILEKPKQNEI